MASPREVLVYLRRHQNGSTPPWVLRADVADAITLVIALRWEHRRQELYWLSTGLRLGLPRRQMGEALGLGTHLRSEDGNPRSGFPARVNSLQRLLRHDPFELDLSRSCRRGSSARDSTRSQQDWIDTNQRELLAAADGLLSAAATYGPAVNPWIEELAVDRAGEALGPAFLALLGIAAGTLRGTKAIAQLTSVHNVHRHLRTVDLLRSQFSGELLGSESSTAGDQRGPARRQRDRPVTSNWIHTPPPPKDRRAIQSQVELLVAKREKIEDPERWRLPDPSQADMADVLAYMKNHSAHIKRDVQQSDVSLALTFHVQQWWEDQAHELFWLNAATPRGVLLSQVGAPFGIKTSQGVRDRRDRLDTLVNRGRPDESVARAARQAAAEFAGRRAVQEAWVSRHASQLHALIAALVADANRNHTPDANRESLDDVARDHRHDELSPMSMTILSWAVEELEGCPMDGPMATDIESAAALWKAYKTETKPPPSDRT